MYVLYILTHTHTHTNTDTNMHMHTFTHVPKYTIYMCTYIQPMHSQTVPPAYILPDYKAFHDHVVPSDQVPVTLMS